MSELRFNELRGEEVAYAIHRQDRTFLPDRAHCPLDPTRPGAPATEIPLESFEVVVFDNRFPAFEAPGGAAEVVVYTDDHDASLASLPLARVEELMWVWRHRYRELGEREDVEYVYIFENRGVEVGVTLHHPHGQIYGYPFLPPVPARELAADARLGGCAPCALLERERADGARVLFENEAVSAFVPARRALAVRSPSRDAPPPPFAARVRARRAATARRGAAQTRARIRRAVLAPDALRDGCPPGGRPGRHSRRRPRARRAGTSTSSSTRRCAPLRS